MVTNDVLLHLQGGTILSQALIVLAMHEAKVMDKKHVIELVNYWLSELDKIEEEEANNLKMSMELLLELITNGETHRPPVPDWFRGIIQGGKNQKKTSE